jgi:hypothetical protein
MGGCQGSSPFATLQHFAYISSSWITCLHNLGTLKTIVLFQILMSAMRITILAALRSARTRRGISAAHAAQDIIWRMAFAYQFKSVPVFGLCLLLVSSSVQWALKWLHL